MNKGQVSTCNDCQSRMMPVQLGREICGLFKHRNNRRKLTKAERRAIWEDADGKCQYCGTPIPQSAMEVDHIVPFIAGGKDERSNMICACHACNHYKHAYGVNGMRDQLERLPDKLQDEPRFKLAVRYGLMSISKHPVVFEFERRRGYQVNACNLTHTRCDHGDACTHFKPSTKKGATNANQ